MREDRESEGDEACLSMTGMAAEAASVDGDPDGVLKIPLVPSERARRGAAADATEAEEDDATDSFVDLRVCLAPSVLALTCKPP